MKIALKYGIAVTLIIAAWVALKHFVLHLEGPSAQLADLAIFNLSAIVALMMGIKERRIANGDRLTFLQGLATGVFTFGDQVIPLKTDEYLTLARLVLTQVDGPPKGEVDVTSAGEPIKAGASIDGMRDLFQMMGQREKNGSSSHETT